jgi:hypothetical protein
MIIPPAKINNLKFKKKKKLVICITGFQANNILKARGLWTFGWSHLSEKKNKKKTNEILN